ASVEKSVEVLERLIQSYPNQASHHAALGRSWNAVGYLRDELRQNAEAIPAFKKALAQEEKAVALSPDDNEYKVFLCTPLENLGEQYADLGQVDQALPYYARLIALREELVAAHPEKRDYLVDLAETLATLGIVQRHSGDSAGALRSFA